MEGCLSLGAPGVVLCAIVRGTQKCGWRLERAPLAQARLHEIPNVRERINLPQGSGPDKFHDFPPIIKACNSDDVVSPAE